jgi:hypothetical protein
MAHGDSRGRLTIGAERARKAHDLTEEVEVAASISADEAASNSEEEAVSHSEAAAASRSAPCCCRHGTRRCCRGHCCHYSEETCSG